jgi:hypothetical protein
MTAAERVRDLLPPPYAVAPDTVTAQVIEALALELDVQLEDLDRLRQTHWVQSAYRMTELTRLGDLVGIAPLPGEPLGAFRVRLLALVTALMQGAVGPAEIRRFVCAYLSGAERALNSTFVPGLARYDEESAYEPDPQHPAYRPLAFVENPPRTRRSQALAAVGGRVPYLHRWEEANRGLDDTVATFAITGLSHGRTAVPVLVNVTTGDLIGYAGTLRVGQRIDFRRAAGDDPRAAAATLDGRDVTERVFSVGGFVLGTPFALADVDPAPRLPRLARGVNDWIYLAVGLFDVRGLDRVFFAIADAALREGAYDQANFDQALFPSGPLTQLEMEWEEHEPAAFEIRVPSGIVTEAPELAQAAGQAAHEHLVDGLRTAIERIHAAGVRAAVHQEPFTERQEQQVRVVLPWLVIEPEAGPVGEGESIALGGRFGESALDRSRFE